MATPEQNGQPVKAARPLGEASPLLHPRTSADGERLPAIEDAQTLDENNDDWLEDEDVQLSDIHETKSSWYMFLLTLSMGG